MAWVRDNYGNLLYQRRGDYICNALGENVLVIRGNYIFDTYGNLIAEIRGDYFYDTYGNQLGVKY